MYELDQLNRIGLKQYLAASTSYGRLGYPRTCFIEIPSRLSQNIVANPLLHKGQTADCSWTRRSRNLVSRCVRPLGLDLRLIIWECGSQPKKIVPFPFTTVEKPWPYADIRRYHGTAILLLTASYWPFSWLRHNGNLSLYMWVRMEYVFYQLHLKYTDQTKEI